MDVLQYWDLHGLYVIELYIIIYICHFYGFYNAVRLLYFPFLVDFMYLYVV